MTVRKLFKRTECADESLFVDNNVLIKCFIWQLIQKQKMKTITFTTTLLAFALFLSACQNSADKVEVTTNSNFSPTNTQANSVETTNKKFESLLEKSKIADEQTVRLKSSDFNELPKEIIKNLEQRGCTIPQIWHDKTLHNVISGEFSKKGQKDWAVLCSINRVSSILVFGTAQQKMLLKSQNQMI